MTTAAIILVIAVLLVGAVLWERRSRVKAIERAFRGRQPLTPDQYFDAAYRDGEVSPEVVAGIRQILEEQLQADLSRLREHDDFSKNLRFFWDYDSLADVEIVCALEERFSITIGKDEARRLHTFDDIVRLIEAKREKAAQLAADRITAVPPA